MPKINVSIKFIVLAGILVTFTALSFTILNINRQKQELILQKEKSAKLFADLSANRIFREFFSGDPRFTIKQRITRITEKNTDIMDICLLSRDGKIIFAFDSTKIGTVLNDEYTRNLLNVKRWSDVKVNIREIRLPNGEKAFETTTPAIGEGAFYEETDVVSYLGSVRVIFSLESIKKIVSVTQKQSLTIFLIIVLIGIIVSFVLSQVFVRPIMKLTENVKKISLGNLHVKTDVKANDEIGELATAFNKMASDLNLNIESLESKNKELEMFAIALRESEEKYRTLIENSSDAVLIIDTNGYFSLVNKKFCEISGYSLEEVEGTHFSKLVHPEDLNLVMERNIKRLKGDNDIPNNYEFRIIGKKGEVKYIDFSVSSIKKGNEIVGIQGTARDITDRKKLEEQLLQSQKMESIGRLSGGIAHDFNNLLAAILPNAELIKMQTPPATMLYQCADAIKQAAERASELVKQFLSFSRQGKYKLVTFNPNKLIKETIKLLERTIGKDINIETDLEENLSGIDADETQIEQIILNLAVNARDAMPNGGKIVFSTRNVYLDENFCKTRVDLKPGYYVCISVRDTGTGIKKEFMDKIFDPFFTTKEVSKGTGLGLSVVYGIVKNHNGHVGVYSEVGKGTEFKIYLPVSEKAEVVEKPRQEEVIAGVGNETILVVDDEPVVLDVASSILKTLDYKVMVARDGLEAVEIYQSKYESIDLILLDMMMPRLDGRETFKRLKEINPKVRVLLSSGYSQDDRIQQALKEGVAGFIRKPYSIAELSKSVREVLKH